MLSENIRGGVSFASVRYVESSAYKKQSLPGDEWKEEDDDDDDLTSVIG